MATRALGATSTAAGGKPAMGPRASRPTPQVRPAMPELEGDGFDIDATKARDPKQALGGLPALQAWSSGRMKPEQAADFEADLDKAIDAISRAEEDGDTKLGDLREQARTDETRSQSQAQDDEAASQAQAQTEQTRIQQEGASKQAHLQAQAQDQELQAQAQAQQQQTEAQTQTQARTQAHQAKVETQAGDVQQKAQREASDIEARAQAEASAREAKAQEDKSWWDRAKEAVASAWDQIKAATTAIIQRARATASQVLATATRLAQQLRTEAAAWVQQQWASFQTRVTELGAWVKEKAAAIWETTRAGIAAAQQWTAQAITTIQQSITQKVNEIWTRTTTWIAERWDQARAAARAVSDAVTGTALAAWQGVGDTWGQWTEDAPSAEEELFATAEERAEFIHRAVRGLGTDEDMLLRALHGSTAENQAVARAYRLKYGEDLSAVIESELSGTDLQQARDLLSTGQVSLETRINRALEGWGADDERIVTMWDQASEAERATVLANPALMFRLSYEGSPALAQRLRGTEKSDDPNDPEAAEAQLTAKLDQRGQGWGTDEEGMYADLTAFAKAHPAEAKRIADDPSSPIYQRIDSELDGRDLDKALGILRGGGGFDLSARLQSESDHWGTDEAGIFEALTAMSETDRQRLLADPVKKAQVLEQLQAELSGADLEKAKALLDDGKEDPVEKLRGEAASMIVNDRTVIDTVASMSTADRERFRSDGALRADIRGGVSVETWATVCALVGNMNDGNLPVDSVAAETTRQATLAIDAVSHLFDNDEDRIYKAIIDAQRLAAEGKLDWESFRTQVLAGGHWVDPNTMQDKNKFSQYTRAWEALNGGAALTSRDRLDQATNGIGTDDTALSAMIDDLSGKDLLENWSNIADLRARHAALRQARQTGDQDAIRSAARRVHTFILDINPAVLDQIRGDTGGSDQTTVLGKLRKKLQEAGTSDPEFRQALADAGMVLDPLEIEKMDYVQSTEEMDVHRHEGQWYSGTVNDAFSSKGRQLDDAHADYMGSLRTGMHQAADKEITRDQAANQANTEEGDFNNRLQAYKDMKSTAARVGSMIVGTVVAIVTTVLTGGAAAGFWASVLVGAASGGLGAAASAVTKELIQGGSYSLAEDGGTEILLGALGGAIGGGLRAAMGSVRIFGLFGNAESGEGFAKLSEALTKLEAAIAKKLDFLGDSVSKAIAAGAKEALAQGVNSAAVTTANETVRQSFTTEGFLRSGIEGWLETIGPKLLTTVPKDMLVSAITRASTKLAGMDPSKVQGTVTQDVVAGATESTVKGTLGLGYEWVANAGMLSEEKIRDQILGIIGGAAKGGVGKYVNATDMLRALNTWDAHKLQEFKGIGPVLSQRIIDHRQGSGPFTRLQDIQLVSGIGATKTSDIYGKDGTRGTFFKGRAD